MNGSQQKEMRFLRRGELQLRKKVYDKSFFESKKKKKNGAVRNGRNAKKNFCGKFPDSLGTEMTEHIISHF